MRSYELMVLDIASGNIWRSKLIDQICTSAGKTQEEFLFDVVRASRDRCEACGERLKVRTSKKLGENRRLQRLECPVCKEKRGKRIVSCAATTFNTKPG